MSDIIMYIFNNFLLHSCNATNHKLKKKTLNFLPAFY